MPKQGKTIFEIGRHGFHTLKLCWLMCIGGGANKQRGAEEQGDEEAGRCTKGVASKNYRG